MSRSATRRNPKLDGEAVEHRQQQEMMTNAGVRGGKEYNCLREWTAICGSRCISTNEDRPLLRDSAAHEISYRLIRDRTAVKEIRWIY